VLTKDSMMIILQ